MPRVIPYSASEELLERLNTVLYPFKEMIAKELSCSDRELEPGEIEVTTVKVYSRKGMTADMVIDITAAAYPERVQRQDEICQHVQDWLHREAEIHAKAWLELSELGHSDM